MQVVCIDSIEKIGRKVDKEKVNRGNVVYRRKID